MAHFHDNALLGASGSQGYRIERSLRFNSADSAYLSRTPSGASNRKTFTISLWLKRSALLGSVLDFGFINSGDGTTIGISGTGGFGASLDNTVFLRTGGGNVGNWPAVFRDTSAWYHFVVAIDSTQATASNRQKLYVNGVDQGNCSGSLTLNVDTSINTAALHVIGGFNGPAAGYYANGYLAEYHFIDGQALTPSSFGETDPVTGVWRPKRYAGTYGTNGFYLKFADNSGTTSTTLGKDSSGNGNNWTPNNFSVTAGAGNDSLIDTPTPYADGGNGRGNYCTANPLKKSASATLTDGNLSVAINSNGGEQPATFAVSSGKWYWEVSPNAVFSAPGILLTSRTPSASSFANDYHYYGNNGQFYTGTSGVSYGATFGNADVIGVALDLDTNQITFYKNGVSQGAKTIAAGEYNPDLAGAATVTNVANFGQRPFAYTPPSGFKALNTQNLPEPSIKKPSGYMDVVTYTGTGSALTPTSSLGFSPDLVWIKSRSAATDHALYDAVRGVEKRLESNTTDAEVTSDGGVTAFNSAGFSVGTLAQVNTNTATYAAWCWDESATPGFDIVTYTGNGTTGATVNHSLGVKPAMVMVKTRTGGTEGWPVWHQSLASESHFLRLNETSSTYTSFTNRWTAFSSTAITLGNNTETNGNTYTYVAYLWSQVAGFSKFGSYTGNGSADGPFVFCGFRPRWVMIKRTDSSANWQIYDTARDTTNRMFLELVPNSSAEENSISLNIGVAIDALSNGFKLRDADTAGNASSGTYIFAAFAEAPQKYSLAR